MEAVHARATINILFLVLMAIVEKSMEVGEDGHHIPLVEVTVSNLLPGPVIIHLHPMGAPSVKVITSTSFLVLMETVAG